MGKRILMKLSHCFLLSFMIGCSSNSKWDNPDKVLVGESARALIPWAPEGSTDFVYLGEGGIGASATWCCFTCESFEQCRNAAERHFNTIDLKKWKGDDAPIEILECPEQLVPHWKLRSLSDGLYSERIIREHHYEFVLIDRTTNRCYFAYWAGTIPTPAKKVP